MLDALTAATPPPLFPGFGTGSEYARLHTLIPTHTAAKSDEDANISNKSSGEFQTNESC